MDERIVARLARSQHGVAAWRQLRAAGIGRGCIDHRCTRGAWRRVHRGVYALGYQELTRHGVWMAAVLACGDGAVLSDRSAAELWGLVPPGGGVPHVTVPSPNGRHRPGTAVHRRPGVEVEEVTQHHAIPVTAPALALLDSALTLGRRGLERALDEAVRLRRCNQASLEAVVAGHAERTGVGQLRAVLTAHTLESTITRSHLEELFLALCRRNRLPEPLVNARIHGMAVDFYWPDHGLVVETDGRASHDTPGQFQRDRERNNRLLLSGLFPLRFTYGDVTRHEAWTVSQVRIGLRKAARRFVRP